LLETSSAGSFLNKTCADIEPPPTFPSVPLFSLTQPFCFSYYLDRVSCFCLGLASDFDPPTYVYHIAVITDMCHQSWLID
jgi:hypothetical protein